MARRLYACAFDPRPRGPFARMAEVLEYSAAAHCAAWQRSVVRLPVEVRRCASGIESHGHNSLKLDHWAAAVEAAADGDELLLIDADTLILRSLDDAWDAPFDLAYTVKADRFPFNLGVVFLRVSPATRAFMRRWLGENRALFAQPGDHRAWRVRWGGINQAAFGRLLEGGALASLQLRSLSCAEWNCEESAWATFDPGVTRIVHIKGELRRCLFGLPMLRGHRLTAIARTWQAAEAAMAGAATVRA